MEPIRNCLNCEHLGDDADPPGGDEITPHSPSGMCCLLTFEKVEEELDNTFRPGFPFETEQPCHVPGFWQYLSTEEYAIIMDDPEKLDEIYAQFKEKYLKL